MPEQLEDLWPSSFDGPAEDLPAVAILKQQAEMLKTKTNGRVEGIVVKNTARKTVYYSFYLRAPALGDAEFKILYVAHSLGRPTSQPFPVTVQDDFDGKKMVANDAEEFKECLRDILNSEAVREVVSSLMRRSDARVGT